MTSKVTIQDEHEKVVLAREGNSVILNFGDGEYVAMLSNSGAAQLSAELLENVNSDK